MVIWRTCVILNNKFVTFFLVRARAVSLVVLLCLFCPRSELCSDAFDEMRASMSMFMELVGMLGSDIPTMPNGCGPGSVEANSRPKKP